MTKQRLHPNLAEIDILTREEMSQELNHVVDEAMRTRYTGLELQRIPLFPITAAGATLNLFSNNDATPWGPEQGDIWMLRRVVVKSFVLADAAKYILFRGSTPSDTANGYTGRWLLEGFSASAGGQQVGVGYYPGTKAVFLQPGEQVYALVTAATTGNQYFIEGEAIRCPAEMKGKLLG